MVRRYPPNPRGTENVFSDIRLLSIEIYVLSFLCLAMGINLVKDKGPHDESTLHFVHYQISI